MNENEPSSVGSTAITSSTSLNISRDISRSTQDERVWVRRKGYSPEERFNVSLAKAEEKRRVTLKLHEGFKRELDAYLMFGGKTGCLSPEGSSSCPRTPRREGADSSIGSKRDEQRRHRYDTVCLSFPFSRLLVPLRRESLQCGDGINFHVYVVLATKSCIAACLLFRHCLYTRNNPASDLTWL